MTPKWTYSAKSQEWSTRLGDVLLTTYPLARTDENQNIRWRWRVVRFTPAGAADVVEGLAATNALAKAAALATVTP